MKGWHSEAAKVIEVFNTPRSYFVETPDGAVYRRNRVNLNTDRSAPAQQPSAEAHPRSSEQDTPEAYDSPNTTQAKEEEPHASDSTDALVLEDQLAGQRSLDLTTDFC